jgi:hypothetical protein
MLWLAVFVGEPLTRLNAYGQNLRPIENETLGLNAMTDDIVTRLRDIATLRGPMSGNIIPMACLEAANEIERLRQSGDSLEDSIRSGKDLDNALDKWSESRGR